MKRFVSLLLTAALTLGVCIPALAAENGSLANFAAANSYTEGQFTDVPAGSTFAKNVAAAYAYGLMAGKSDTIFDPTGNLTVAQAIVMACRVHNIYYQNGHTFEKSTPWYQSHLDYALEHKIIASGYSAYDVPVSRAAFAQILGGALPDEALTAVNTIEDGAIPDVPAGSNYYAAVYRLYRAGVLTGSDAKGTFGPFSNITRGAAAAIISRMADTGLRKSLTLRAQTAVAPVETKQAIIESTADGLDAISLAMEQTANAAGSLALGESADAYAFTQAALDDFKIAKGCFERALAQCENTDEMKLVKAALSKVMEELTAVCSTKLTTQNFTDFILNLVTPVQNIMNETDALYQLFSDWSEGA